MRQLARRRFGHAPGPAPRQHAVVDVGEGARIEDRLAGRAARTPVLGDVRVVDDAELVHELPVRPLAQDVLVQDRDLRPFLRLIQAVGIDAVQPGGIPFRPLRALEGRALAPALDRPDIVSRRRQLKRIGHSCAIPRRRVGSRLPQPPSRSLPFADSLAQPARQVYRPLPVRARLRPIPAQSRPNPCWAADRVDRNRQFSNV